MAFQENLRYYREKAGYKQAKEFAEILGITYTTYVGYENKGREPKYSTLCKIADLLNVSTDELLGRRNNILGNQEDEQLKKIILEILSEYDTNKIISFHEFTIPIPDELRDKTRFVFDIMFKDNVAAIPKVTLIKYINQISTFSEKMKMQLIFIYLMAYLSADKSNLIKYTKEGTEYALTHKDTIKNSHGESLEGKDLEKLISYLKRDLELLKFIQKSIMNLNQYKDMNLYLSNQNLNTFIRQILNKIPTEIEQDESNQMSDEELEEYMQKFEKIFGKYDDK